MKDLLYGWLPVGTVDVIPLGSLPLEPTLMPVGVRQPLHADAAEMCRLLQLSDLQRPLNELQERPQITLENPTYPNTWAPKKARSDLTITGQRISMPSASETDLP